MKAAHKHLPVLLERTKLSSLTLSLGSEGDRPAAVRTHCEGFGSRCSGTGGRFFVPVQIQPDFALSHLLEEINTYFLKIHAAFKEVSECARLSSINKYF